MHNCDICVIGGGIAGISAAAEMAATVTVVVCEAEDQPGYHATGRSAARFAQNYGPPVIRALSAASRSHFEHPPAGFTDVPLLLPGGEIFAAGPGQETALAEILAIGGDSLRPLSAQEMVDLQPLLRRNAVIGGAFEAGGDLDVHAVLEGYRRRLLARGGRILTGARVTALSGRKGGWTVDTAAGVVQAARIVNAAGAWGDRIAELAGATPLGLVPKRRTALTLDLPDRPVDPAWPMVVDAEERIYFKPEAGRLLVSPADETPSPPCDAQPEELDIAIAIDRLEALTTVKAHRIIQKWAGLRTFLPDKAPAVGPDPEIEGFYWLVGQGGYGIQTAPAMARAAAAMVLDQAVEPVLDPWIPALAPSRFRTDT